MGFETKKALLEYLGKNPGDNKLIDRMLARGEVEFRDGMYYLVESDEVRELRQRVAELEGKLTGLKLEKPECGTDATAGTNTGLEGLKQELEEAKINMDYYRKQMEKYKTYCNYVIENTYNIIKPKLGNKMEEFSEFKISILNSVRERMAKEGKYDED